jgi:hypothetical protein
MGFFHGIPPSLESRPDGHRWHCPTSEVPRVALSGLLLAQTEAVAVGVTAVWAYTTGFEFWIGARFSQKGEALECETDQQALHIGLQFADGRRAGNAGHVPSPAGSEADGLILSPLSFGGGLWQKSRTYWVWPLPPPGALTFVCEWARFGIPEQRTVTDGRLIIDAAKLSYQPWPDTDSNEDEQ